MPPDDEDALVEAFIKIVSCGNEELNNMGIRSRTFAEEHLTREVNLSMVVESINKVLE